MNVWRSAFWIILIAISVSVVTMLTATSYGYTLNAGRAMLFYVAWLAVLIYLRRKGWR